jgi:hypothetical protein
VTLDRRRRGSEHDTDETTKGDPLCPAHMASDARSFGGLPPNLRLSTVAICNGRLTRIHDVRSLATNACKGSSPASQQGTRDFAAIGEVSEGQIVPVRRTVGTGGHQAFRDGLVRPLSCSFPAFSQRSLSAHLRLSLFVRRPTALDPLLPFKIGPVNGREARESGLRLKD